MVFEIFWGPSTFSFSESRGGVEDFGTLKLMFD